MDKCCFGDDCELAGVLLSIDEDVSERARTSSSTKIPQLASFLIPPRDRGCYHGGSSLLKERQ